MRLALITALIFALNAPRAMGDDVVCDNVVTSTHGTLVAKRVTDRNDDIMSRLCLGDLRLLDTKKNESWCLASRPDGRKEEVLQCAEAGGNRTTLNPPYCDLTPSLPEKVWISSTQGVLQNLAGFLGQYEIVRIYEENKKQVFYVQSDSWNGFGKTFGKRTNPKFLYPKPDCTWYVSYSGQNYLRYNRSRTSVPTGTGGWKYIFKTPQERDDSSLTVTTGSYPLEGAEYGFMVSVSGNQSFNVYSPTTGFFAKTDWWWFGRPVFKNSRGRFLMHGTKGWMIGQATGDYELRGYGSRISPADPTNWQFFNGSDSDGNEKWDKSVTVSVTSNIPIP